MDFIVILLKQFRYRTQIISDPLLVNKWGKKGHSGLFSLATNHFYEQTNLVSGK